MAAILFYKFNGQRTRVTQLHPTVMTLMDKKDGNMLNRFAPDARNLILEYLKRTSPPKLTSGFGRLMSSEDSWARVSGRDIAPRLPALRFLSVTVTSDPVSMSSGTSSPSTSSESPLLKVVKFGDWDLDAFDHTVMDIKNRNELKIRLFQSLQIPRELLEWGHDEQLLRWPGIWNDVLEGIMAQTLPHFDLGLAYIADNNPVVDPPQRSRHTSEQVFQQVLNQVPRSEVLEWTDQQDILRHIVGLQPRTQAWETLVQIINGPGCATVQDVKDAVEIIWKNFVRGLYSSLSDFRRDQVVEEP
ncbi:hypothetical protein CEP53_014089, partial [Fusarium sp. AF-6]